jgi:hypothetical protein
MIHHLPLQGMLNHGLINYNPKFFWMLVHSNSYRMIHLSVGAPGSYYSLPPNIVDAIARFDPGILGRRDKYRIADLGLIVILQKLTHAPYVAPIDIPTGASAASDALAGRYPSIFARDKFLGLARFDDVLEAIPGRALQRELLSRYRRRITSWLG